MTSFRTSIIQFNQFNDRLRPYGLTVTQSTIVDTTLSATYHSVVCPLDKIRMYPARNVMDIQEVAHYLNVERQRRIAQHEHEQREAHVWAHRPLHSASF